MANVYNVDYIKTTRTKDRVVSYSIVRARDIFHLVEIDV